MGLFSFVKNAGAKIFGKKAASSVANATSTQGPTQEELDVQKAMELEGLLTELGFCIEDLYVQVNDDTATISGKAKSWEDKEKVILACGNVEGIAQVDDQLAVVIPEDVETGTSDRSIGATVESTYYTVQKGDTLGKIAKAHYGNAMKYPVIFEANRPMLKDPNQIYPDQVLRIPPIA